MSDVVLAQAIVLGLSVAMLGYDPIADDLIRARVDGTPDELAEITHYLRVLYAERGQILVALRPNEDASGLHMHDSYSHAELLPRNPGPGRWRTRSTGARSVA